jgi:energy-coupling factor transporter ATP-binding protein EcfA2
VESAVGDGARRILVLGSSGSGKSTLAKVLAAHLSLPHVPTDHAFWTADWRPAPPAELRGWIDLQTSADAWVLDGNFDFLRELVWARAELAVWLDFPVWVSASRAARRNLGWVLSGQRVWNNQRMTLRKALSGVRHAAVSNGLKHRTYPAMLAEFPGLRVVRLRSPSAVARWLATQPQ